MIPLCGKRAVFLEANNLPGVVCVSNGKLVCCTCKYGRSSYAHATEVLKNGYFQDSLQVATTSCEGKIFQEENICSKKISFVPTLQEQRIMQMSDPERFNISQDNLVHLMPDIDTCPECGSTFSQVIAVRDATLITSTKLYSVKG